MYLGIKLKVSRDDSFPLQHKNDEWKKCANIVIFEQDIMCVLFEKFHIKKCQQNIKKCTFKIFVIFF